MHDEVGRAVGHDTVAKSLQQGQAINRAKQKRKKARKKEEQRKGIIPLKGAFMVRIVMVLMHEPQEAVHHVLMEKPSHQLHRQKSRKKYREPGRQHAAIMVGPT